MAFVKSAPHEIAKVPQPKEEIHFAIDQCSLGKILVAQSEKGVCAILLGDATQTLTQELQSHFKKEQLIYSHEALESTLKKVAFFVDNPQSGLLLPLDIRGTDFQRLVWQALSKIGMGATATYAEVAASLDKPKAYRAVAQACAANVLAVAIPCHRVVRSDGDLAGYRWGVARKKILLQKERPLIY